MLYLCPVLTIKKKKSVMKRNEPLNYLFLVLTKAIKDSYL